MSARSIADHTRRWIEHVVIGLNFCPFARSALEGQGFRLTVTRATDTTELLGALRDELALMISSDAIETTVLVHPDVLNEFHDYNDFVTETDALLATLELTGVLQIATFHPHYQFAGTAPMDAENYTNRSPYPMLHLLREDNVAEAVARHADTAAIPEKNIERAVAIGAAQLKALRAACMTDDC